MSKRLAHDDPFLDSEVNIAQRRYIGSDGDWRWIITPDPVTSVVASDASSRLCKQGNCTSADIHIM